jgi:hypothetical protein
LNILKDFEGFWRLLKKFGVIYLDVVIFWRSLVYLKGVGQNKSSLQFAKGVRLKII